ncbi:heavy-metal-associated domain-containing protein [Arthrobacter castelli]|uniref:heavy-metal-associated domain-containing protein n=1 Tax=Arthrobacter castelli TaxID=271431 RepID=UPI00041050DE|nr:heavy-metal-associated domain-containing protein [Arthrobacter castelli]
MSTRKVDISGMACGHCIASVTEELSTLEGVGNIDVVLNKGGVSAATITASRELDPDKVNEAVVEAGSHVINNKPEGKV